MSLQTLWWLVESQPGQWLNGLALFFAMAGACGCCWLQVYASSASWARLLAGNGLNDLAPQAYAFDAPALRLNRFFYRFGYACQASALLLSWLSTQL